MYLIKPWDHQLKAINTAKDRRYFALFFEMGTGKTMTAINILRHWFMQDGYIKNSLILCPPIVIDQWAEEFEKHSNISRFVVPVKGTGAKRLKIFKERLENNPASIFITNYETLSCKGIMPLLLRHNWFAQICDESHKLKNHAAKRTKLVTQLADQTFRKLILTGSPVLNSPMDIFSQIRIMDKGENFGKNFYVFRAQYFYDRNANMPKTKYFPDWVPNPNTVLELGKKLDRISQKALKSECIDLPPLVKTQIPVELNQYQKMAYNEMKDDLITYLDGKAAVANIALTKILRLQQIISGFVGVGDKGETHSFKDVPRLKALHDLLEELTPNHKVIVWAGFIQNYKKIKEICDALSIKYVELHGGIGAKEKQTAITQFREDDKIRVCIANQKSAGVGVNLVEASYAIYYSRGYSLEDDLQSESRNYRGGSERHSKITRIDLVSKGTVDEIILKALAKKQSIADKILDIKEKL